MASDVSLEHDGVAPPDVSDAADEPVAEVSSPTQEPRAQPPQAKRLHRKRFVVAYVLLAAAIGAAVAGIVLAAGSSLTKHTPWSSWVPTSSGTTGAKQIAAHVSKQYHLPSGEQLVEVFARPPSVAPSDQQVPLHYIVVQRKNSNDPAIPITSGDTVQYSLCGLGDNCAIAKGTPSVQRGTLVRREILELALYTFKYMHGVKNIIAFMPPTPGATPKYVVFLQRDAFAPYLGQPITKTLNSKTPLPNTITRKDQQTVDATTESRVYQFRLAQAQDGNAVLVLAPLPA